MPKLEIYRAKLFNPPSLVGMLRTRPLDRFALSVCLAVLTGSASADTFSFDGDGGNCDWAEGQSNKYVEIGYEGSLFVDVTRGMAINAGILEETKLNNGLYQYYVGEEGIGEFWVTFDPKSGKLVEGKIADRAEMSAVDWTVAANVTDLKPCEKGGSGSEECDDCDTVVIDEQPETATTQKRPTPQTCEDGIGILVSALKLRQGGYDLLGAYEKLLSDIQKDERLAYIAEQPTFSNDVMDTVRLAYSGQFDGFDLSIVQTMMVSNCLDQ